MNIAILILLILIAIELVFIYGALIMMGKLLYIIAKHHNYVEATNVMGKDE